MNGAAGKAESVAARGARWMTVGLTTVGLLNYGYSLILTRLLGVAAYSSFAAGQGLILWASTIATVAVPMTLAQSMARARSDAEAGAAIRFSKLTAAAGGVIAAAIVGVIAIRLGGSLTALIVAASTFVIFLGTASTGWLQGRQRMRALSALYVGENVLKNLAGLGLVIVVGLRGNGALAAFGIGGIVMLVRWPRTPRGAGRPWRAALANRDLWRRTLRMTAGQSLVSLFISLDVVLVALLPGDRALVASYQASAALSRIALFVAGSVVVAFFQTLSRQRTGGAIAARAVGMYGAVVLPLAAVLATIPAPVITVVFPAQYAAMATLLKFTAVTALVAGGISLIVAFFQATDDSAFLPWLCAGLAGYVVGLLVGWRVGGIGGLAAGGALGAVATLILVGYRLVRREGFGLLSRVPLVEPAIVTGMLVVLRPHAVLWLVAGVLVGLRAGVRFLRRQPRHARVPLWIASGNVPIDAGEEDPAVSLLVDTVWRGTARTATAVELDDVLTLARRNRVEGRFARAYPARFPDVLEQTGRTAGLLTRNLHQVADGLHRAGIPGVLLEAGPPGDHVAGSIDLVVAEQHWRGALTALADWYVQASTYRRERSAVALLYPSTGPGLHVHTSLSWFGLPALSTHRLLAHASTGPAGFLVPAPADYLLIWLAQALFQNLTLDLCTLLALRNVLRPTVITTARAEASREGWRGDFDNALGAARDAIDSLDRGVPVSLPVQMPVAQALGAQLVGVESLGIRPVQVPVAWSHEARPERRVSTK